MHTNFLDTLDYQIITELQKNARIASSEIARLLGANERTIRKRIDRLVDLGAVRLTAVVNPAYFNYATAADIFIEADPQLEEDIIARLLAMQEISYLALGQGTKEISIEARFKDNGELRDFIRVVLPSIPGIKVTGYALVPRILRNIDEWIPKEEDFGSFTIA